MELLQQEPSQVLLGQDSATLTIEERTRIKWLLGIVGLWAVIGIGIASISMIAGLSLWIAAFSLGIALGMDIMTLLSWVVNQTCRLDAATNTVTLTQKRLLGQVNIAQCAMNEIVAIELTPKTHRNAWSYYVSLKLTSGKRLEIDLTSSEAVDRAIVRSIECFLGTFIGEFKQEDTDQIENVR